ncbi:MAG: 3'(2'),5'-bisphosphate nucleotidase CysQ [Actinobacteria bacterium]|nr:3'(2'),5'-bisphosphate nucleotidase CysQ [Actinomycetota bacterium]
MDLTGLMQLCALVREAGAAIMQVYRAGDAALEAVDKADGSPLTLADRESHRVLAAGLEARFPGIPVLSEEGREIPYEERRAWNRLWLVDPLDGTKEFVKGLDEFTVNVALIEEGAPVAGAVYAPALDRLYAGGRGLGAFVQEAGEEPRPITVRSTPPAEGLAVVQSRSHPSPELEQYLEGLWVAERVSAGSSLKLCLVAEGRADLYPRLGPTMEWDTAAGQAVVEAAGGEVRVVLRGGAPTGGPLAFADGGPLRYNREQLLNPWFVVRAASAPWPLSSRGFSVYRVAGWKRLRPPTPTPRSPSS